MSNKDRFKDISGLDRIKRVEKIKPILSLKDSLIYCIKKGFKIDFMYEDGESEKVLKGFRNVAPAAVGKHISTGNEVVRAYLNAGVSKSKRSPYWRLFRLDRITSYNINYSKNRVGSNKMYRKNDKHISEIFKQV
jgi:hypothetical protein